MTPPEPTPSLTRIQKIEIQGLFGLYNHTIPLNLDERVTILYGVNGVGKTTVLNIIEQVFGHHIYWQPNRLYAPRKKDLLKLFTRLSIYTSDSKDFIFETKKEHPSSFGKGKIAASNRSVFIGTQRIISFKDEKYRRLMEIAKAVRPANHDELAPNSKPESEIIYIVQNDARELAERIAAVTVQYGKDAQALDQSFPLRALQAQPNKTLEDVRAIIQRYEAVQDALQRVNIFPANHTPPLPLNDTSPEKLAILYVHTEDSINKLAAFQDIGAKANALLEMVNSRLIHKTMEISREHGFQIKSHTREVIPLNSLSSGEQHQLVILFELIFRTQAGALVLIDEPEISMHLSWQSLFIRDLIRIAKMNAFDAIVATHSPAIIDKYWNLTVELKAEIAPSADAVQASHA